jgi:predicted GNAT family acetyltransferase
MVNIKTEVMKQTAVEWLVSQLNKKGFAQVVTDEEINQAKEMEKQQITDAYWVSYKEGQYSGDKTADEYYNETFKSE